MFPRYPDIFWRCPDTRCLYRMPGDMDSPYDADRCPAHGESLIKEITPPPPGPTPSV